MNIFQFVCAFCVLSFVVAAASKVVFPDHRQKSYKKGCGSQCTQKNTIPVTLARQLSNIDSFEQFLSQFVENGGDIASNMGLNSYGIRMKSPAAQNIDTSKKVPLANCKPELQTISLRDTNDPTLIYYPTCVRLEKCGGCCNHELLHCEAIKSSPVNVTIMMTKYVGNKTLKYIGKKIVTLIKHELCSCDCKSKPQDCKGRQVYRKEECRCVCANEKEEFECANQPHKLWDPSTCQCGCREMQECSTGYEFDNNMCKCAKIQQLRIFDLSYFRERI